MDLEALLHIARTNATLTEVQRATIRETLASLQEELDHPPVLRRSRLQTTKRKLDVQRSIDICTSLLNAYIRLLPPEILCYIFKLSCREDPFDIARRLISKMKERPTIHHLVRVCSYWRELARYTPSFWSHTVVLDAWLLVSLTIPRWEKLLSFYGRNLIRLEIHGGDRIRIGRRRLTIKDVLLDMSSCADQLTSLTIHHPDSNILHALSTMPTMNSLEKLRICGTGLNGLVRKPIDEYTFPVHWKLPNLQQLHLEDACPSIPLSALGGGLRWCALSRFTLSLNRGYFQYHRLLDILHHTSNLVHLRLNVLRGTVKHTSSSPPTSAPIVMSKLRVLEVTDVRLLCNDSPDDYPILHFFANLSTPSLRTFKLVLLHKEGDLPPGVKEICEHITVFLERATQLSKVRIIHAPREWIMAESYTRSKSVKILRVAADAQYYSEMVDFNLFPKAWRHEPVGGEPSPRHFSCLRMSSSDYTIKTKDVYDHIIEDDGDSVLYQVEKTPVTYKLYEPLYDVSRHILAFRGGVERVVREARVIWDRDEWGVAGEED